MSTPPVASKTTGQRCDGWHPDHEITRVIDEQGTFRKFLAKHRVRRLIGEPYIGRRVKMAHLRRWIGSADLPADAAVLEVGSGDGTFCFDLAERNSDWRVLGLELNPTEAAACERLAKRLRCPNLRFFSGELSALPTDRHFDLIICLDVLEHVVDDVTLARQMGERLAPGGRLVIHVPNRYYKNLDNSISTIADEEAWRVNPGHVRAGYTPEQLREMMTAAGLEVQAIKSTNGRPITKARILFDRYRRPAPLRVGVLPVLDRLIRQDLRQTPEHGNTVWGIATRANHTA